MASTSVFVYPLASVISTKLPILKAKQLVILTAATAEKQFLATSIVEVDDGAGSRRDRLFVVELVREIELDFGKLRDGHVLRRDVIVDARVQHEANGNHRHE